MPSLIMILWVWALRFPHNWLLKAIMAGEVMITFLLLLIELDARNTPGNGGWMMMFFAVFQIYAGLAIGFVRLIMWCTQDK